MRKLLLLMLLGAAPLRAQSGERPFNIVMANGSGRVRIELPPGWQAENIGLFDSGTRPVIGMSNEKTGVMLSYILFPNDTGAPTAESCRDAVVTGILQHLGKEAKVEDQKKSTTQLKDGRSLAQTSYLIAKMGKLPVQQQNEFGFAGDKTTCAEIHLSKTLYKPADAPLLDAELERFPYEAGYVPTTVDYETLATIYYRAAKNHEAAALYYQRALDVYKDTDSDPAAGLDAKSLYLFITDQLTMSYGMSGDLKRSRGVAEAAVARFPDYAFSYFNLACADAEAGDAAAAKTHLEQAYARRKNTLPGETLPDASQDDSLQKLKNNQQFWSFVESLPKP